MTLEAVEEPGLTTTTGVPELVDSAEGLGKILLPLDPGKLWVMIFIPIKLSELTYRKFICDFDHCIL